MGEKCSPSAICQKGTAGANDQSKLPIVRRHLTREHRPATVRARPRVELIVILAALVLATILHGCIRKADEDKIGVIVTILPQKEMVEAIGGDRIRVTVMVPPNANPHTYSPTPGQMAAVAQASIYFKVGSGVEFEIAHMDEITAQNKALRVVDCSKGIDLIEGGEHEGGKDPHIWLSPTNAKQMVRNMCDGLVEIDRENEGYYTERRDAYLSRLDQLDLELRQLFSGKEGCSFLVYHPAWAYFARDYAIQELAVEEAGKRPGPTGILALVKQAKENGIRVVFVSPQFDSSSAKTIAEEIGGTVVSVDPLAENYIENLRDVAAKLAQGLATKTAN